MINDNLSLLLLFTSKLGLQPFDSVVQRALKLVEKNLPISHVLAEVLLYTYLRYKGYRFVSVEETVGDMKCDVYVELDGVSMCIEVETFSIPLEHILNGVEYVIAKHVKKAIQATKSGINVISFAYPFGVIPLIPLELLKKPEDRVKEELLKLFNLVKKFFTVDIDDIAYLETCVIGDAYIYDLASLKVELLTKEKINYLINMYTKVIGITWS